MSTKLIKIAILSGLFILLAMVRIFENELFYDPFIQFFKQQYSTMTSPNYSTTKLLCNIGIRYFLNFIISLAILYTAFKNIGILKFAVVFYSIAFCILLTVFSIILAQLNENNYQLFFYIRRFLIQPIFVLLLLPAFYYQRIHKA